MPSQVHQGRPGTTDTRHAIAGLTGKHTLVSSPDPERRCSRDRQHPPNLYGRWSSLRKKSRHELPTQEIRSPDHREHLLAALLWKLGPVRCWVDLARVALIDSSRYFISNRPGGWLPLGAVIRLIVEGLRNWHSSQRELRLRFHTKTRLSRSILHFLLAVAAMAYTNLAEIRLQHR